MQINLITVGNIKEKYWIQAQNEYLKRLTRYCKLVEYNLKDENDKLGTEVIINKESLQIENILNKINNNYVITLDVRGKKLTSEKFSEMIEDTYKYNTYQNITFIIGGSHGLSQKLKDNSNFNMSFSDMTFPHQMFKIIFLEQLYRSFKIIKKEKYHK